MRHAQPDVLSPELALVCPELAAAARAALPERPWELFAPPPRAPRQRPVMPPPAAPRLRVAAPAPAPARRPPAVPSPPPRVRRRPGAGAIVGLLTLGALIVTGLLPARDAPRLTTASAPQPTPATPVPAMPATPPRASPVTPGLYVVSDGGTLVVAPDRRELAGLDPPTRCLPAGATLSAPIAADGSFGVLFPVGTATVELSGRVVEGRVSGSYRIRAPGCDSGRVRLSAAVVPKSSGPARSPRGASQAPRE